LTHADAPPPAPGSPDELRITRDGDDVIIAYADESVATTHFKLGRERIVAMTVDEIIDFWNDHLNAPVCRHGLQR
jgi:hypothetical protein